MAMDFQSAMETFAEAWVAATAKGAPLTEPAQSQALALTRPAKSPPLTTTVSAERIPTPVAPRAITPHENTAAAAAAASNVSPTLKDQQQQFDVSQTSPAKSLPVHCIVEAVCSLDDGRSVLQGAWRRRPFIETDSYVIIPTGTPFQGLVQTALLRLGYSAESAAAAKGSVIIRNWKPLNFDQISEDPLTTVGDILGELTTVATLRIQVFRGKPAALTDIKEKLLRFFLMQSHGLLISSGCPLDEICRSNPGGSQIPEISDEIRRKFEQWWAGQHGLQASRAAGYGYPQYTSPPSSKQSQQPQQPQPERTEVGHPALQTVQNQFPAQKTRMRTSFDPELELPKLQRWFADNQHPTRQQIQQYVKELNNLESRRGRKPLDVNNVVYWFKNARAAQKRAEIRNIGPGLSCHMVNGYGGHGQNGSGFVLAEEQLKEMCRRGRQLSEELSNSGYEMEEEDPGEAQPSSPFGPLSLTTRKDGSRGGSPSPFSPSMPPDIRIDSSKTELKEEPINYHSPNSSNNNNNEEKANLSELEDDEGDSKSRLLEDSSPLSRSNSGRFCPSPETDNQLMSRVQNENLERLAGLPMVPNSMFSHSIMYMSHYIPGFPHAGTSPPGSGGILGISSLTADDRRKRNRTFIDPVSEVPRLEQWFSLNTHPSHNLILKYTEELNCMTYRQKFPKLEPKNVQFWFKNRRAKCKRLKMSLFDGGSYNQSERE